MASQFTPAASNLEIIGRALAGQELDREQISRLLSLRAPAELKRLFEAARRLRERFFGKRVFLYGFTLFSTHCRNQCAFCHYRASNLLMERYRKNPDEIMEAAAELAQSGVHLIDLTMGEDPRFSGERREGLQRLQKLVSQITQELDLPVMVSPGLLSAAGLAGLTEAGADWYALYQETHNPELFRHLRRGQDYGARMAAKLAAHKAGLLIEEGVLRGVGETTRDIADSIMQMRNMDAAQVRVMTFVPQAGTPLAGREAPPELAELITLAVMRLVMPHRLIPASLDVGGLGGLKARLEAGANVVTSLVPPGKGWAGVAHHSLDIEEARRTPQAAARVIQASGLRVASREDYRIWIERRRTGADIPSSDQAIAIEPKTASAAGSPS
jgi:methylornithine synthase